MRTSVEHLDTYDIKVGDKVYILRCPSKNKPFYHYYEGILDKIDKDTWVMPRPSTTIKNYSSKESRYQKFLQQDERDKCKFMIKYNNTSKYIDWVYTTSKYLYTEKEFDILQDDINKLNSIYKFKKQQAIELDNFISTNFSNWCWETSRKEVNNE